MSKRSLDASLVSVTPFVTVLLGPSIYHEIYDRYAVNYVRYLSCQLSHVKTLRFTLEIRFRQFRSQAQNESMWLMSTIYPCEHQFRSTTEFLDTSNALAYGLQQIMAGALPLLRYPRSRCKRNLMIPQQLVLIFKKATLFLLTCRLSTSFFVLSLPHSLILRIWYFFCAVMSRLILGFGNLLRNRVVSKNHFAKPINFDIITPRQNSKSLSNVSNKHMARNANYRGPTSATDVVFSPNSSTNCQPKLRSQLTPTLERYVLDGRVAVVTG